jgi:hypothetical protein
MIRIALLALAAVLLVNTSLDARTGSWCASYDEGATGCGYDSQEQCRDTMRGIGGRCIPKYRKER